MGNLLKNSAFLASKLGNGPLLEHGPVIEILRYLIFSHPLQPLLLMSLPILLCFNQVTQTSIVLFKCD